MRRFLLLCLIFCGLITGCTSNPAPSNIEKADVVVTVEKEQIVPNSTNVKALGRTNFQNNRLWLGYTNTGVEFNVSASYLEVTILGDSSANGRDGGNNARIVAFVNNERVFDKMIIEPVDTYVIFNKTETVNGVVRIIKVSECSSSIAAIESIGINKGGSITPTEARNLKIEFIGDSITCGYGVDGSVSEPNFTTNTEDGSKSYAYKTAQALNADYSMVSVSGSGIISCYSGDGKKQAWGLHGTFYEKTGFSGNALRGQAWDFSTFKSDIIVINLGTNDSSYVKNDKTKTEEFQTEYIKFLKQVRVNNPDAKIICSLGIMGQDLCPAIENAVKNYKDETGDTKVSYLKFANQSSSDGYGVHWHPSEKTHQKAANLLASHINQL